MQQDGWKVQDGRKTKTCRARSGMHNLARHFFPHSAVLMRKVPDVRLMTETSFDDGARNRNIQTWRLLSSSEVRVPLLNHAVEKRFWECFPITVKNFFV